MATMLRSTKAQESPRKAPWRRDIRKTLTLLLMGAPGLLLLFVFVYLPMAGIVIAFTNYKFDKGVFGSDWVGLNNFKFLFATSDTLRVTWNTLFMNGLFIITGTVASIAVAILMNEVHTKLRARLYQSAMFFPYFISMVVVGYFVFAFLSTDDGLINRFLTSIGAKPVSWYRSPQHWPAILVIVNLWKGVGVGSIIYLAGILAISPEIFEAARIDGATKGQQIIYITLPLLTPIIVILVLLSIGNIFRADFGLFFTVTRDQPQLYPTTDVIDTFVYRALRKSGDISLAAAAGFYQSIVGFILVLVANWVVRRVDPDRSLF